MAKRSTIAALAGADDLLNESFVPLRDLRAAAEAPVESGIKPLRLSGNGVKADLVASITAHGLIVPLIYQAHEKVLYVIDGNCRLAALREIHGEESTFSVAVMNVEHLNGEPAEIALAATIIRSPLHMVDKFEAFAALVDRGAAPIEIAQRFSIRVREVEQALAVAALAPEVREAWRRGDLGEAAAQAFTLEPDQKRQAAVFKKLSKRRAVNEHLGAYAVRRELVGDDNGVGRLLTFVGADAYEAAGGRVLRDLFEDKHAVADQGRLKRMADEKLAAECHRLVEVDGWAFAVVDEGKHYGWKRVILDPAYAKGDKARLADIRKQLNAVEDGDGEVDQDQNADTDKLHAEAESIEAAAVMRAWSAADRAKVGCVVSLDAVGGLEVAVGYQQGGAFGGGRAAPGARVEPTPADKKKAEKVRDKNAADGVVSKALDARLAVQLRAATKLALLNTAKAWEKGPVLKVAGVFPAYLAALAADLIKPENNFNMALSGAQMEALRAGIDPAVMNAASRATFDAKDYVESIPKANLVAVVREVDGDEEADRVAKLQVAAIKKVALSGVKKGGWLPPQLRTPHYDAAGSGKPKRGGKR